MLTKLSPSPPLRIVFQHTRGPLAGLYAIMGLTTDFGLKPDESLPVTAEGFEAHGCYVEFAGLVKVTRTYALYREPLPFGAPDMQAFDERQL